MRTGNRLIVLDFEESDCYVGTRFKRYGAKAGLVLRWKDDDNYLYVHSSGTYVTLSKVENGSASSIAFSRYSWPQESVKLILAELHGEEVRVMVDDQLVIDTFTAFNQGETKHGLGGVNVNTDDEWLGFGGMRDWFTGRIDTIVPKPKQELRHAYIRCFDDMERLSKHLVLRSSPPSIANAKKIINVILDASDVSVHNRVLDDGVDLTLEDTSEKALGRNAQEELYQVQNDEVGLFYIDGAGLYRYEASDHRSNDSHIHNSKIWTGGPIDSEDSIGISDLEWDDGKDLVENEIYYSYFKTSFVTGIEVWRLIYEDRPLLEKRKDLTFLCIGEENVIVNPVTPHPEVDIVVTTEQDGTGITLTLAQDSEQGDLTWTGSPDYELDDNGQDFTDWNNGRYQLILRDNIGRTLIGFIGKADTDGDGTRIELYNSSFLSEKGYQYRDENFDAANIAEYDIYQITAELVDGFDGQFRLLRVRNESDEDGYLRTAKLRGDEGKYSHKTAARAESPKSQIDVGRRRVLHESLHIDRFDKAQDRAYTRLGQRAARRERLKVNMKNGSRANLMQIIHRNISDRVGLLYSEMGIQDSYTIEHVALETSEGGNIVSCDFTLHQAIGGLWGDVKWSEFTWG